MSEFRESDIEYVFNIDFKVDSKELWKIKISTIDKKETELSVTLS